MGDHVYVSFFVWCLCCLRQAEDAAQADVWILSWMYYIDLLPRPRQSSRARTHQIWGPSLLLRRQRRLPTPRLSCNSALNLMTNGQLDWPAWIFDPNWLRRLALLQAVLPAPLQLCQRRLCRPELP